MAEERRRFGDTAATALPAVRPSRTAACWLCTETGEQVFFNALVHCFLRPYLSAPWARCVLVRFLV